jgi:hypothetical protein
MAQVTIDARIIEESLVHVLEKLSAAIDWIRLQHGNINLDVPEPFEHTVGPASRKTCFAPPPDQCGDIAILVGVFNAREKRAKGSRARGKAKPRRK